MSISLPYQIIFLLLPTLLFYSQTATNGLEQKIRCKEVERQALLEIKEDLHELKKGFLSSWGNEEEKRECCEWYGIRCTNNSGHVTALDLVPLNNSGENNKDGTLRRFLRGKISLSLRELNRLEYLDLSLVDFSGTEIPSFIGGLAELRYLNLSYTYLAGEIPRQLGNLSSLEVLDLQYNALRMKSMGWVSHLSSLRVLDLTFTTIRNSTYWMQVVNKLPNLKSLRLSHCGLGYDISSSPLSLVNSSASLSSLDLSSNGLSDSVYQLLFSFKHSLRYVDISYNNLNESIPEAFGEMSALEYLDLHFNDLEESIPSSIGKLTSLAYLDLSSNKLDGPIPPSFGNMASLAYLNLRSNNLDGEISEALGNLSRLTLLSLEENKLEGEFPKSIWNLCLLRELYAQKNNLSQLEHSLSFPRCTNYSLQNLDLSQNRIAGSLPDITLYTSLKKVLLSKNRFNGTVPETIGKLTQLEELDLSGNSLEGVISESHFSGLAKLSVLDLSDNSLVLKLGRDWIPPFRLDSIILGSCKLGTEFPRWLRTQVNFSRISLSNSGVSDSIPDWFWDISSKCSFMNLSNNQIHGKIQSNSFELHDYLLMDLSSNELEGPIPQFMFKVSSLNLSKNRFSGLSSICNVADESPLIFLDVSSNHLSGGIPDCWSSFTSLNILALSNNNFSGEIPISISSLTELSSLHMSNNSLTKELPLHLKNCSYLKTLVVDDNNLEGPIPTWIGESLSYLIVLSLRSNRFNGTIPSQICQLSNLQLLDLSLNNISGSLPRCIKDLSAMKEIWEDEDTGIHHPFVTNNDDVVDSYQDEVNLIWKGKLSKFDKILGLAKFIDLSSNNLMGEIPVEISELTRLVLLNLSRNGFSGEIPSAIGKLAFLDVLDLSNNQLSGRIPSGLAHVPRLNFLDLSKNRLSGKIPTATQLQSFETSSYAENLDLCGAPLPRKCPGDELIVSTVTEHHDEEGQDKFVTVGFYVSLSLGFVFGFMGICGSLILSNTWRYSYFSFLRDVNDRIFVRRNL